MKKYKILIIIWLLLTVILWVSFATGGVHSAANNAANATSSLLQDGFKMLQNLLNLLYIFIRPFLFIAWKLLWNDFVYWSVFKIDSVLWQVWQMSRTAMNYFLGIIFIISIFVYFFKSNSKISLPQIFPKIVLASLVVNASWFLLAVLLDLSTIFTVAAGNLWMQFNNIMAWAGTDLSEKTMILPVTINTDSKEAVMQTKVNGKKYDFCIRDKEQKILNPPCINFLWWTYELIGKDWGKQKIQWWIKWKDITGSTGMLFAIFRYMNMAFVANNTDTEKVTFWLYVLKIILMLALVIPFIVLCIVVVIRVMVLRAIIPLSPFLFWLPILWVFDKQAKDKLTNVIALIFQPAYVVFMLAIWFIMIQSLYTMMPAVGGEKKSKDILKELSIEKKDNNEIEFAWILNMTSTYDKWSWTTTDMSDYKNLLSYISWIIANLIAIMVLWILVFTALKSNSFTRKIATSVDTFTKQWLKTLPVLPWGQSLASLQKAWNYLQRVPEQMSSSQFGKLQEETKKFFDK